MNRPNNGPFYAMCALGAFLVGIVALVLIFGNADANVERVITFAGLIITQLVGFVVVGARVNSVDSKTQEIAQNVNGKLDARLNAQDEILSNIHAHIKSDNTEQGN